MALVQSRGKYLSDIVEPFNVDAGGTTVELSADITIHVISGTVYLKEVDDVVKDTGAKLTTALALDLYVNEKLVLTSENNAEVQIFVWGAA